MPPCGLPGASGGCHGDRSAAPGFPRISLYRRAGRPGEPVCGAQLGSGFQCDRHPRRRCPCCSCYPSSLQLWHRQRTSLVCICAWQSGSLSVCLPAERSEHVVLTIPALLSGKSLFCIVPAQTKRHAVHQALRGPISPACPASILRRHPNCVLYLDTDSFDRASPGLTTS
jgi:hypothetical protein